MSLLRSLLAPQRSAWPTTMGIDDYIGQYLQFGSFGYGMSQTYTGNREEVGADFAGLVQGAYRSNGVVFACIVARLLLFSEARFQFQQMRGGRPGDLFGTADLGILERPEPGKTTGDLLARAITDADLSGNWFAARRPGRIKRMRPDWTWLILGSPDRSRSLSPYDIDAEVVGYVFQPGGPYSDEDPVTFSRNEVAHFAPIPDPLASYRGMSPITPIIRELRADSSATLHKLEFFQHAATPNVVVKFDPKLPKEKAREFIELFEQEHAGTLNAYRTAYLGGGADLTVVGSNMQQMAFKETQGAGETRIAAAFRVPAAVAGFSEGLQGSSLNAGNYMSAKRQFADAFARPYWRNMAGSLETIVPPPPGARLWYDDRDIPFLQEDIKDAADVQAVQSTAINVLVTAGFTPETVISAITAGDFKLLEHTGLPSVQVQPGNPQPPQPAPPQLPPGRSMALLGPGEVRCTSCNRLLAEQATAPYRFTCTNPKCKAVNEVLRAEPVWPEPPRAELVPNVTVTISEGAFQVHSPITVEPSPVTIEEGAVRVEVNTPPVTIEAGAVQVDVSNPVTVEPIQVTVEPTQVTIEEGAISVPAAQVTIAEGAVNVTVPERSVEPAQVNIAEGAVRLIERGQTRSVIDRDENGVITGTHEEPLIEVAKRTVIDRDETGRITGSHEEIIGD